MIGVASGATKRERTCIGCGRKAGKDELLRIVRLADGTIRFDARGNEAGRGAYVCSEACFDKAIAGSKFQRALRAPLGEEDVQKARAEIHTAIGEGD